MSTRTHNPFRKPITLDNLDDLFAHHRAQYAGWKMIEDGGTGGTGGDTGDKGGKPDEQGGTGGKPAGPPEGKTYTAADLTAAVESRVGELTRKHEKALEDAKADAGRSDTQRLEAERDRAVEASKAAATKAAPRVAQALAQVAAITAGGRADRAAAIVRVADLDGVAKFDGDDWTVDDAKVTAAIEKVLEEYPEWKTEAGDGKPGDQGKGGKADDGKGGEDGKAGGTGGGSSRSGGALDGGASGGDMSLDEFARTNMAGRQKLATEDPEQYARLAQAEIVAKSRPAAR